MTVHDLSDPFRDLVEILDLKPIEQRNGRDEWFEGQSHWMFTGRTFGGQILGQSLSAAAKTIDSPTRIVHSLHGYFLRPGDLEIPIHFAVDRIRDGRSYSTRRVQAFQNDLPIFSCIASFQEPEPGLEHQDDFPSDIPDPETLPKLNDLIDDYIHDEKNPIAHWSTHRPFDMRFVPSSLFFFVEGERVAHQAVWLKTTGKLNDDANLHRAAIAYASDYTILESIYRKHGIAWSNPKLRAASLDHAIWFHRPARADEWLLYVQESPTAQGGRGLAIGRFFTKSGELVATVAQEGSVRISD
ncbi:MAG: hypothetical protein RLZZ164_785 [Actinomycetota bacterium]|jgi:acyl-CoA thioesterase-2